MRNIKKTKLFCVKLVLFCVVWHILTGLSWFIPGHAHNLGMFDALQLGFSPTRKGVFPQNNMGFSSSRRESFCKKE